MRSVKFGRLVHSVLFFWLLGPWAWMLIVSLKSRSDIMASPPRIFGPLTLEHYATALYEKGFLKEIQTSFMVAVASSAIAIVVGTLAAYGVSRKVRFGEALQMFALSTRFLPAVVVALPLFWMNSKLGLDARRISLVVVHASISLSIVIVLLRTYFDEVPGEIDEAAQLDGANVLRTILDHICPAASQGLIVVWIWAFLNSWNELLFATVLTSAETRTLPVVIPGLVTPHGTYWGQVAALGITGSLPAMALGLVLARGLGNRFARRVSKNEP